jgi:hypothetical protein
VERAEHSVLIRRQWTEAGPGTVHGALAAGGVAVRAGPDGVGLRAGLRWAALALAFACAPCAHAETWVYLLRGWFGVFSTGMDGMAEALRARGIQAEAVGHLAWKSTVEKILEDRTAGKTGRLVLVGHSQGGNNVIDMARELAPHGVRVDLLITLVPFQQDPVPANVARAINYYQSPGWGSPLTAAPGFGGELANINLAGESSVSHINIDKSDRVQAEIVAAIAALPR